MLFLPAFLPAFLPRPHRRRRRPASGTARKTQAVYLPLSIDGGGSDLYLPVDQVTSDTSSQSRLTRIGLPLLIARLAVLGFFQPWR